MNYVKKEVYIQKFGKISFFVKKYCRKMKFSKIKKKLKKFNKTFQFFFSKMQAFKKILKDNFLPFIYTSTLTGSVFMGYISYKIQKNKKQYELNIDNDRMKDTTRLSYDFYGINWGVASDDMIKEKLDSGDALFVKYECNECINLTGMCIN